MGNPKPPAAGVLLVLLLVALDCCSAWQKLVMMPAQEEQSVFQGDSFYVSCSSESDSVNRLMWTGPEEQQITDYTGSVPYNKIARIHVEDGRSGNKGVDLVFENINRKDRGKYTCSANVEGTEESVSFTLYVNKKIDFKDTPAIQFLEEGRNSELFCDVDGDPMPTVSWTAHGRKVIFDDKYQRGSAGHTSLMVMNVTMEDGGAYQCNTVQLSEIISEMEDFDIEVKVHHKPVEEEDGMQQAYSYMTGRVNLTCEAVAEPQARFTWIKDGEVIAPSATASIFTDAHQSVLQLIVNNTEQFGDYLCKAENRLGTLERVIVLEKGDKPPMPELKIKGADVNSLHLELSAARDPAMPILAYKVQYKEHGIDWNRGSAIEFKNGDEYVINSLKDNTLYMVRASARNAAGYSDFTKYASQRTEKVKSLKKTNGMIGSSCVPLPTLTLILTLLTMAVRL